jgi:D-alanine-D-alanine ligase-like ATP-grasp enzyme
MEGGYESIKKAAKDINIPESFEDLKKMAEPAIEKGKEILREMGVTVKVDLNSSSQLLANMVVDEIIKNPQLKANFMDSITKNIKEYA